MLDFDPKTRAIGLLEELAKPCIFIRRTLKPPNDLTCRSKLGGLPNLPADIPWPCGQSQPGHPGGAVPMQFYAQIDCTELPRLDERLPTDGLLLFFAHIEGTARWISQETKHYCKVIYLPISTPLAPPRRPPTNAERMTPLWAENLPMAYYDAYAPEDLREQIFNEWPIDFVVTDSYPPIHTLQRTPQYAALEQEWARAIDADDALMQEYGDNVVEIFEEHRQLMLDKLHEAAPPQPANDAPFWQQIQNVTQSPFPPTAEIACIMAAAIEFRQKAHLAREMESHTRDQRKTIFTQIRNAFSPKPLPQSIIQRQLVIDAAQKWLALFRAMPRQQALQADQIADFIEWFASVSSNLAHDEDTIGRHLIKVSMSRQSIRDHLPPRALEIVKCASETYPVQHQILGHFDASQDLDDMPPDIVPLLMLSYDDWVGMRICDVGEMHFYISEADLQARDFDRVTLQFQGG